LQEPRELLTGANRGAVVGLVSDTWRGRAFGDFWAHVLVARGSAEVVLEPRLSVWDYAAVEIIVREAGGRVSTFAGEPLRHGGSMLTTNGLLHDDVLARLAEA